MVAMAEVRNILGNCQLLAKYIANEKIRKKIIYVNVFIILPQLSDYYKILESFRMW